MRRNMPLDFYISISISDDKLTAYLLINNADDDFKVTAGQLEEFVQNESHHSWCKSNFTCSNC